MHRLSWLLVVTGVFWTHVARGETFELDSSKCRVVGRLFRGGVGLGHDHLIAAGKVSGRVTLDPARPESARIRVSVAVAHLRTDPAKLRRRYRLDPLDADDVAKIDRNMRGTSQLHAARYRSIVFRSTRVRRLKKSGRFWVEGTLSLRGVRKKVTLEVKARIKGGTFKGSGQLRLLQSWFGYKPYKAALGLVKVKDRALVDIYLEGRRVDR